MDNRIQGSFILVIVLLLLLSGCVHVAPEPEIVFFGGI